MAMNPRLLRPTASGFNPKRLAGLEVWLDATVASSITIGTGVSIWADLSGNTGRNATQSTGANQPNYVASAINGKPALEFIASGARYMFGSLPLTLTAETVFLVGTMTAASGSNARLFSQIVSGQINDFQGVNNYGPAHRNLATETVGSFAGGFVASRNITYGVPFVFSSTHSGSQISNRVNNGAEATEAKTLNTTFVNYLLTNFNITPQGGYLTGLIAEVAVFSRALNDAERTRMATYLGSKWGIAVT